MMSTSLYKYLFGGRVAGFRCALTQKALAGAVTLITSIPLHQASANEHCGLMLGHGGFSCSFPAMCDDAGICRPYNRSGVLLWQDAKEGVAAFPMGRAWYTFNDHPKGVDKHCGNFMTIDGWTRARFGEGLMGSETILLIGIDGAAKLIDFNRTSADLWFSNGTCEAIE